MFSACFFQSARLETNNTNGDTSACGDDSLTAEEGGNDDPDQHRNIIIKTVPSSGTGPLTSPVNSKQVIKLNVANNNRTRQESACTITTTPVVNGNGKHSTVITNGDDKSLATTSVVKVIDGGSSTKVLTSQEGKSLLSLGKTTTAKVRYSQVY